MDSKQWYLAVGVWVILTAGSQLGSVAFAQQSPQAWCFHMQGEPAAYIRQDNGDWFFVRPGQPYNVLAEIARHENEVVLQNKKMKLFIKLTEDRAYWRQPAQDNWTTYYHGAFGVPPKVLVDLVGDTAEPTSAAKPDATVTAEPVPSVGSQDYKVRVAYFVPNDRQPVDHWEQKIRVIVHFVDSMYRNDLQLKGFKSPGLSWQQEDGKVKVHLVRGQQSAAYYTNAPVYDDNKQFSLVAKELVPHIGKMSESLGLVFCETYSEEPADVLWKGSLARGAYDSASGGLGMFSAHLLRDEFCALTVQQQNQKFFDQTPVPGRRAWGHRINSARCEFTEDGFGAVVHELGHALGLPHDMRDQDRYIMSNGFRQIRRNLSPRTPRSKLVTFSDVNTHLLMSSRFLNPKLDRTDNVGPEADIQVIGVSQVTGHVELRITASDANGLRAYVLVDGNAGSLVSGGPLGGEHISEKTVIAAKAADGMLKITLIVADNGGNQTRVKKEIPLAH